MRTFIGAGSIVGYRYGVRDHGDSEGISSDVAEEKQHRETCGLLRAADMEVERYFVIKVWSRDDARIPSASSLPFWREEEEEEEKAAAVAEEAAAEAVEEAEEEAEEEKKHLQEHIPLQLTAHIETFSFDVSMINGSIVFSSMSFLSAESFDRLILP